MVHTSLEQLIVRAIAVAYVLMFLLAVIVLTKGLYSTQMRSDEFVSRKRPAARVLFALMGLTFGCGGPFLVFDANRNWADGDVWVLASFCLLGGVGALYAAGPQDFRLDIAGRTYRLIYGWPLFARTKSGTAEEIWGVFVAYQPTNNYFVGLRWWDGRRRGTPVRQFGSRAGAEGFALDLAERLGVQMVAPPRPLMSARSRR